MSERANILDRIREALRIAAPERHFPHGEKPSDNPLDYRKHLPPSGGTYEERVQLFSQYSETLKTQFIVCSSDEDALAKLKQLASEENWKIVACHSDTETFARRLDQPYLSTDQAYDKQKLEKCDVGISGCEALIAQTGSVLITTKSSGGRALSVLPPQHVVIARRNQLVGDLTDGFNLLRKKYGANIPAYISFITGPSRTGDIERILVLGAHGPKKLTVLLIG